MKKILIIGGAAATLLLSIGFGAFFAGPLLAMAHGSQVQTTMAGTPTTNSYCEQYLQDLAQRLHVSVATLQQDTLAASEDELNQLVKDGKLTQSQANEIKQRLESHKACTGKGQGVRYENFAIRQFIKKYLPDMTNQVAVGLHTTNAQLTSELKAGKSLQAIAQEHNVTPAQLHTLVMTVLQTDLNKAVSTGDLTQQQATAFTQLLQKHPGVVDRLLNQHFKAGHPKAGK